MPEPSPQTTQQAVSRKATLMVSVLSVLIVVMIVLFWQGTWFGRELTDAEIGEYLTDEERPRRAQHALVRISERVNRDDRSVTQWYPAVIDLADHSLAQLRANVAWLMGQDNTEPAFHAKLGEMLGDEDPLVRRNAALSLTRFGDNAGHSEVRAMLEDFTVLSPHRGVFTNRLAEGDTVDAGTLLARVEVEGEAEELEVRSPVPGIVEERLLEDGAEITEGTPVIRLGPDASHVFEALRGLYLIGTAEDIEAVRRYYRPREDMSASVAQQAQLTVQAIRERSSRQTQPAAAIE